MATKMRKTRRLMVALEVDTDATAAQVRAHFREDTAGSYITVVTATGAIVGHAEVVQVQVNSIRPTKPRPAARKR